MKFAERLLRLACWIAIAQPVAAQSPPDWAARAHLRIEHGTALTTRGFPARLITARPTDAGERLPGILFIPWLSCDPVEVDGPTDDGYIRFVRDLAADTRAVVMRVEKPGVAGSAGPDCSVSTLDDDMAAFRAAFTSLRFRADVDTSLIFLVGGSIGGAFAVALAAELGPRVAGVVSVNSYARTWYEHMIDHERRRLTLAGMSPDSLGAAMRAYELFYTGFLIEGLTPGDVIKLYPELRRFWYDTTTGQYGRSAEYFREVQLLDVDAALARLDVPALFIAGDYDWVMGSAEAGIAAARVNRYHPGRAITRLYPRLSHGLHTFISAEAAFRGTGGQYDARVATDVAAWIEQRGRKDHAADDRSRHRR